ncbi:VanZ family protein [Synoicihabitans lomoniglobus]|uniref:VanZ family protein n=1 Tax=Synoicihabitans lomoniglobus TaxID=2909285 RepID=A0AAF0CMU1_9BACT|nr:VanZ family protein [Opitutaceae bacterium LMO-M01]WED63545.1 VanZ family protein [Opitutaceae bacterium LMO-M01]
MIFVASGRGQVAVPPVINIDKITHFAVFGLLGTLIARTQRPGRWWVGILLASLYGLVDEWRQSFTPGRSVEVADWVADTLGALTAVLIYTHWKRYRLLLEKNLWRSRPAPVAKS